MGDGSEWDIDLQAPQRTWVKAGTWRVLRMPSGERLYLLESDAPGSMAVPPSHLKFLRQIASQGGRNRAARHSRKELAAWGRLRRGKTSPSATITAAIGPSQERAGSQSAPVILSAAEFRQYLLRQAIPPSRTDYLRQIGRKGGLSRAARYSSEQRREWARLGGLAKAAKNRKRIARAP